MTHYINDSATPAWQLMSASLKRDDGHTFEMRDGLWTIDGMATLSSYRSAAELTA